MPTVPDLPPDAETLSNALHDKAFTHPQAAAVCLLAALPGAVFTQPGFARYLTVTEPTPGHKLADVNWRELGADVASGHTPVPGMSEQHRALLMIAASLAGGLPIHLGALVACLDEQHLDLALAAIAHTGGKW